MSSGFLVSQARANVYIEQDGSLGVIDFPELPFLPKRFFWLSGIDPDTKRASHAHKKCHQLLMCLSGEMTATVKVVDGGEQSVRLRLGDMLHLEPMMWLELTSFTDDGVLGVMASEPYDPEEYINSFEELEEISQRFR